jgi:hypothetical protein
MLYLVAPLATDDDGRNWDSLYGLEGPKARFERTVGRNKIFSCLALRGVKNCVNFEVQSTFNYSISDHKIQI